MIRLQIRLTETQAEALRRLAASQRVSVAALIRQAVDDHLVAAERRADTQKQRALSVAGRFNSGRPDLSVAHDEYLVTAYQA